MRAIGWRLREPGDQLHDHLGIGVGLELDALSRQFLAQFDVILDDAVMHDHEFAVHTDVRMGVVFGGRAVRRPPGVADADGAADGVAFELGAQIDELADIAAQRNGAVIRDSDPRRVVAAIFQALQPVDDQGGGVARTDITDNTAHSEFLRKWNRRKLHTAAPRTRQRHAEPIYLGKSVLRSTNSPLVGRLLDIFADRFRVRRLTDGDGGNTPAASADLSIFELCSHSP